MDHFIWDFDPILTSFQSIHIHWYGLMFALALLSNYALMYWIYWRELGNTEDVDRLLWYCIGGTVIGARLAHIIFYNLDYYLSNPAKIFAVWEGGLASHGGLIGVLIALSIYQRKARFNYLWILDRIAIAASFSSSLIRVGNFLNSEIIGTASDAPWAVIFTHIDAIPRHPVQLYEALSYASISLFLFYLYKQSKTFDLHGRLFAWSLILIFSVRFILEFFKVNLHSTSNHFWLDTGQLLSLPFILIGSYFLYRAGKS
ncbi:MAG: prolipoprotein diacylglyceryl transferase [Methyloprofundus sp.]|nr:prolipoprotein diacylglyceryl transferase [Methyloprofundus sp.]MDT8426922.1 prolipoprotein diacylglyceryl transferase [Methyloprofundus sp.]